MQESNQSTPVVGAVFIQCVLCDRDNLVCKAPVSCCIVPIVQRLGAVLVRDRALNQYYVIHLMIDLIQTDLHTPHLL